MYSFADMIQFGVFVLLLSIAIYAVLRVVENGGLKEIFKPARTRYARTRN